MSKRRHAGNLGALFAVCVATASALGVSVPVGVAIAAPVNSHLEVTGDRLVHEFDLSAQGETVESAWVVRHSGNGVVQFKGSLVMVEGVSSELAQALQVEFGQTDQAGNVSWSAVGSLDSAAYTGSLTGSSTVEVAVRVVLAEPDVVRTTGRHVVAADFVVSWVDSDVVSDGSSSRLAITGQDSLLLLVVAFSLLLTGRLAVVRSRRRARAGSIEQSF